MLCPAQKSVYSCLSHLEAIIRRTTTSVWLGQMGSPEEHNAAQLFLSRGNELKGGLLGNDELRLKMTLALKGLANLNVECDVLNMDAVEFCRFKLHCFTC